MLSSFISVALLILVTTLLVLVGFAGYNVIFKKSQYVVETGVMMLVTMILIDILI